jgi:hypothetical protein
MVTGSATNIKKKLVGETFGTEQTSGGPIFAYDETIEYQINGEAFHANIQVDSPDVWPIKIFYNPRNPDEIRLREKMPSILIYLLFLAGVAFLILDIYLFISIKSTKNKQREDKESSKVDSV